MPLKTPWVCILYWAPQRMGVVWLSLSYPALWLQTQRRENKAQVGPQEPFGNVRLQQKEWFLKAHRIRVGFCLTPLGLFWKQGFVMGGAAQCSCQHHAALPQAQILTHTAPSESMPLSDKPGKVTVAGFHPQQVVHHLDGRADSCEYLRNEQMPQIHINYSVFLSAPHDSVLTR